MQTLAVLGAPYTYTDFAAHRYIQSRGISLKEKYYETIEDIFHAVSKGGAHKGIVPLENILYGTVRSTFDQLFQQKLSIVQTFKLPVHHSLIVLPKTKKSDIDTIIAHEQAFAQCSNYLRKYFPHAERFSVSSTAAAFKKLKQFPGRHVAVIGPETGANAFGLKVIDKNIEDSKDNVTIFAVIQKKQNSEKDLKNAKNVQTVVAFYFHKDSPGTLHTVLEDFAKAEINLTRIESRPARKKIGGYIFFINFEGSLYDKKVRKVLKNIKRRVADLKILGSFEAVLA